MIKLEIKRPNGQIETTDWRDNYMDNNLFAKIKSATKDAGKGEVLRWYKVDNRTPAEIAYIDVLKAQGRYEDAAEAGNNPQAIITLRKAAEAALADWSSKYPDEAKKMQDDDTHARADRNADIGARYVD